MRKFKFLVCSHRTHSHEKCTEEYDFQLIYNNWNNYGYYTSFHLYDNKFNFLGHLSIVCQYQRENALNPLVDFEGSYRLYEELPNDFGAELSLDLCYKLTQLLPNCEDRKEFFKAIHAMTNSSYLRDYDCYMIGVCRNANLTNVHVKRPIDNLYNRIFLSDGNYIDFAEKDLVVYLDNEEPIKLHFGSNRICWLKNHAKEKPRKTLYEIGLSLYRHHQKIDEMRTLEPTDAKFNKIIFVSHKSFLDNYSVPRQPKELNQESTNLYCYAGLHSRFDLGEYDDNKRNIIMIDSVPLRNINQIAKDLNGSFIKDKVDYLWNKICYEYAELYDDKSLSEKLEKINVYRGTSMIYTSTTISESLFDGLEAKHKIFIHTLGMILKNIQPYSIILFDTPDIFLESRQTIFLINKLSEVCKKLSSVMIIN